MKKTVLFPAFTFILILTSCGPAAEDRQVMHERAKIFQDSIANMIRTTMAEAEAPANVVVMPTPTPAPGATTQTVPHK